MLNSMRMSVMASNSLTFSRPGYKPLQYSDALYLATRGSANILDMNSIGALNMGMQADILLVDMEGGFCFNYNFWKVRVYY